MVELLGLNGHLAHEAERLDKVLELELLVESVSIGDHGPAVVEQRLDLQVALGLGELLS